MPAALLGGTRGDRLATSVEGFLRVNRKPLESPAIEPQITPTPEGVIVRLRPDGVIGATPLLAPDSHQLTGGVVVRPRFGWRDIGALLGAIGWSAAPEVLPQTIVPGSAREVPPWVLAGSVLQRFEALLKSLTRGFRLHEEVRQQPRGQILWQRYTTEQMVRGHFHELPCRYPELGPDLLLRAYLRWGLERVRMSLAPWATSDQIARRLIEYADTLIETCRDVLPRPVDRMSLDRLVRGVGLPTPDLRRGLEALGWIADERGLAGQADLDGLAWRLPMHVLFERWTEHIVRLWAALFAGQVRTAADGTARYAVLWLRPGHGSLGTLEPDIVVAAGDTTYFIDAKYKGHFEELDDHRWHQLREEMQAEHRHDLHQVLAYASLVSTSRCVAVLVYPLFAHTWAALAPHGGSLIRAEITGGGRQIEVALAGIPLHLSAGATIHDLAHALEPLRTPLSA